MLHNGKCLVEVGETFTVGVCGTARMGVGNHFFCGVCIKHCMESLKKSNPSLKAYDIDTFSGLHQVFLRSGWDQLGLLSGLASSWPFDWLCRVLKALLGQQLPPQQKHFHCLTEGKLWLCLLQQALCGCALLTVSELQMCLQAQKQLGGPAKTC